MKKLTILVATIDCVGHVNSLIGTTRPLLDRGHRLIFMANESYRGKLSPLGFEEYIIPSDIHTSNAGESWANDLVSLKVMGPFPMDEKYRKIIDVFTNGRNALETVKQMDRDAKVAIEKFHPDLMIIDGYLTPSMYWSGIPWVNNVSISALAHCSNDHEDLPPSGCGIPSNAPRDDTWYNFKKLNLMYKFSTIINDMYEHEMGYPRYPNDRMLPYEDALLSLYAYPDEYNFPAMRLKGWFNIEVFNKNVGKEKAHLQDILPVEFYKNDLGGKWSGKWVYLSMGSMGSIDLSLMKRLAEAMSEMNHKFIVSKGPRHEEFELPENAWGGRFLPQMKIVPLMDLVVTHAGNNTTTETFAQGIPMVLMPLFGDQYDNGIRLHETGFGRQLDPYDFTSEQFADAVNDLIYDEELKRKLKKASERILSENRHEQIADEIEKRWMEWSVKNGKD